MDNINMTDLGERMNDTKKEIAQLSEELEMLLKSNAALNNINFGRGDSLGKIVNATKSDETKNKDISGDAIKLNIESHTKKPSISGKTAVLTNAKPKIKSELACNKKSVGHNKEVTREFMRQQREKREEQRKKADCKNKIDQALKKQKLLELQQKSLALVQRNLQLKRERSKSRERKRQKLNTDPKPITDPKETKKSLEKSAKISTESIDINSRAPNEDRRRSLVSKNLQPTISQNKDLLQCEDLAARKIQNCYRDYRARKQRQARRDQLKHQNKESAMKESKETQTSTLEKINFTNWLQPPIIDPYPCNFINTIKKKLQMVVSSPLRCRDVGIQSSIIQTEPKVQQLHENDENISEKDVKSEKLVESHFQKESNLDADALQHFALKQMNEKYSTIISEQFKNDSESDTSKNIPEISTESALVLDEKSVWPQDKNHDVLPINTDVIRNLTLRKQLGEDFSNDYKNTTKKSYTFNFSEEEKRNASSKQKQYKLHSEKNVKSPKDSISSFSFKNHSERTSIVSQNNEQQSISSEEIKTEKSFTSNGNENSRRRLIFAPVESITLPKKVDNNCHSDKSSTENIDSSKSNPRSISDQIWSSLKMRPSSKSSRESIYSSHKSSPSSKHIPESINSFQTSDSELQLLNNQSTDKTTHSESQKKDNILEVIEMNSMYSTIASASFSLKLSNPKDSLVLKSDNRKSNSEVNIQSLPKSSISNTLKTDRAVNKSITNSSEATQKVSKYFPDKYYGESFDDRKIMLPLDQTHDQKIGKISEAKDSPISNHGGSNNNDNFHVKRDVEVRQSKDDKNEIHLKFEAEVLLLNDFNESLKQFMAVEKAFESLKNKNESSFRNSSKTYSTQTFSGDNNMSSNHSRNLYSTINISRGSDLDESFQVDESVQKEAIEHDIFSFNDGIQNSLAGLSLRMFEQFIKDEDIRINNLRTIIKIREQALLDRTKGELAWLEIQRKHLKETGKLHEASLVKKKQRGILLKHQQERREMQRLKQLQKIQSNERKTSLKEQKNLIKAKLTSEKLLSQIKIQTPRKQRPSGPMRVLKARESLSETSLSRRASDAEEIFSITSRSRSIKLSDIDSSRELVLNQEKVDVKSHDIGGDIDEMKRALLVRQDSLLKRRKAVEDLLRRHQKLLEEEKKIKELEMAANAIIMQLPCTPSKSAIKKSARIEIPSQEMHSKDIQESSNNKHILDAQHKKNSSEHNKSKILSNSFDTFYRNAKTSIDNLKTEIKLNNENENSTVQRGSPVEYSEDFESEKQFPETESTDNNLSSISDLIEDFTQIEHGISMFSKEFNEHKEDSTRTSEKANISKLSQDIQKGLGISSSKEKSINSSEKSGSAINTGEIKSDTDNLISTLEEEIITQEKQSPESKSINSSEKLGSAINYTGEIKSDTNNLISTLVEEIITQEKQSTASKSVNSSEKLGSSINYTWEIKSDSDNLISTLEEEVITQEKQGAASRSINFSEKLGSAINYTGEIRSDTDNLISTSKEEIITQQKQSSASSSSITEVKRSEPTPSTQISGEIISNEDIPELFPSQSQSEVSVDEGHISSEQELSKIVTLTNKIKETNLNIFENDENTSMETLSAETKSVSQELSESSEIKIPIETENICDENISTAAKDENIKEEFSHLVDHEQKEDTISVQSVKNEEIHFDIPSIENNSELNDLEIKTDDTTNKDISELDDASVSTPQKDYNESSNNIETSTNVDETVCDEKRIEDKITENDLMERVEESLRVSEIIKEDDSIISELTFTESSEEKYDGENFPDESISPTSGDIEKSCHDESSSNVHTDYCNEEKEDILLDSTSKTERTEKITYGDENEDMVKKDSIRSPSKSQTKIVVTNDNSYVVPDQNKQQTFELNQVDTLKSPVQQRVLEISAKTVEMPKSARDENMCCLDVTAYENITPVNTPESGSPVKSNQLVSINTFNNEAEELMKKQLAIELEIKHLEQQQKDQLPLVYMRAIPNKPPPPYTPPSTQSNIVSIWPTSAKDVKEICRYSAKVLYNAHLSNSLNTVTFSESHFEAINNTKSTKECCFFVFDLCREIAENHYKHFQTKKVPSWLKLPDETHSIMSKPFTYHQLENYIHDKVRKLLGFEKINIRENSIIRWSKKRKDHVDEILVLESQAEEQNWMNYDSDELAVKNVVTNAIFEMLLTETIEIYKDICC